MALSGDVSHFPEISVTRSEKAINYWEDITSKTLAFSDIDDIQTNPFSIRIFEIDNVIHVFCDQTDYLPKQAEIVNISGQTLMKFELEKTIENILPHRLTPGVYVLLLRIPGSTRMIKFPVGI